MGKRKPRKKAGIRQPAMIALLIIGIVLAIALYAADVLVWKNPPTRILGRFLLVLLPLVYSLFQIIKRQRTNLSAAGKIYADKIGRAFEGDKAKKRLLLLALVDYNKDDFSACVKRLTKLEEKAATVEERRVTKYFTALCYKECGIPEKAAKLYGEILKETPGYGPALSNLSVIYYDKQNYKKAVELAEQALDYNRDNPFAYNNLAGAYARLYQLDEAKKYALRALELKKDLRPVPALLSILYSAEGDALTAKRYGEMAVSLGQNADNLAAAAKQFKEEYAHHQAIEARIADWKQKTGIPSIHFTLDGQFGKSIIGGQLNEPAPISASGKKMRLLAAFFCSELPKNDIFPQRGVLRFYISPDDYYGASFDNYEEMNVQKEFRVLFDEDELAFSSSSYFGVANEQFPVYGSYRPRFTLEQDGMSIFDFRFEETMVHILENCEGEAVADYQDEAFREGINPMGHKLGGFPCFTQEDPRGDNLAFQKYDTLLFQLDSEYASGDAQIMFGDSGVCNFFIPSENLKRHDFSDILYTWDCF